MGGNVRVAHHISSEPSRTHFAQVSLADWMQGSGTDGTPTVFPERNSHGFYSKIIWFFLYIVSTQVWVWTNTT